MSLTITLFSCIDNINLPKYDFDINSTVSNITVNKVPEIPLQVVHPGLCKEDIKDKSKYTFF